MKVPVKLWSGFFPLAVLMLSLGSGAFGSGNLRGVAGGAPHAAPPGFPTNVEELLSFAPSQVALCDLALLNLLCADGLPGAQKLNLQECLATLDRWTERVRSETERHLYRYHANRREFESSEGYFRMLMMAVVLYEDLGVRYNPQRISVPAQVSPNDHFFADSRDIFLHGMLQTEVQSPRSKVQSLTTAPPLHPPPSAVLLRRTGQPSTLNHPLGTCSSMPVLYVAIGRRLGYPLKLATTKCHVFLRWEGEGERFDMEATGKGMNRYDDEHFKQWPFPLTEQEIQADGYLKSLSPAEELALFLSLRGQCLQEAGRIPEAVAAYSAAVRFAPGVRPYRLLLASVREPGSGVSAERRHLSGPRPPAVTRATPARIRSLNPQLSTLNPQPTPDPNPLLKLRQPMESK